MLSSAEGDTLTQFLIYSVLTRQWPGEESQPNVGHTSAVGGACRFALTP